MAVDRKACGAYVLVAPALGIVVVDPIKEASNVACFPRHNDKRRLFRGGVYEAHDIIVVVRDTILCKVDLANIPGVRTYV